MILLTAIVLCLPCFAGLEDTVGHAAWTEGEMKTAIATFGVGTATNSYTDWLTIPVNSTFATVQILDSTSSSTTYYTNGAPIADTARFAGAITNASFVVEMVNLTVASATPPITRGTVPVFDLVKSASATAGDTIGTSFIGWNTYATPAVPILARKGLYNIPVHGALNMRIHFTRGGATTAATFHWVYVRFNHRY